MDLGSQNVRSIIDERIKLLSLLREELIRRDISPSLINLLLEEFDTVLYIDRNGNIVRYWSRVEKIDRVNVSHREYFIRTKATLKPSLDIILVLPLHLSFPSRHSSKISKTFSLSDGVKSFSKSILLISFSE